MKITFKMRCNVTPIDRMFTKAWDYALQNFFDKPDQFVLGKGFTQRIWSSAHKGTITETTGGIYEVEMDDQEYTSFILKWS